MVMIGGVAIAMIRTLIFTVYVLSLLTIALQIADAKIF